MKCLVSTHRYFIWVVHSYLSSIREIIVLSLMESEIPNLRL